MPHAKHAKLRSTPMTASVGRFTVDADGCIRDLTEEQAAFFRRFDDWTVVDSDPVPKAPPVPEAPPETPETPEVPEVSPGAPPAPEAPPEAPEAPAVLAWCEREDLARVVNAWRKAQANGGEYEILRGKKGREQAVDILLSLDDATRAQILAGE